MGAGQLTAGAVVSTTDIVADACFGLPQVSVAVQVTVLVPVAPPQPPARATKSLASEAWVHVSVAAALPSQALTAACVAASHWMVLLTGVVLNVGGVVSTMLIWRWHVVVAVPSLMARRAKHGAGAHPPPALLSVSVVSAATGLAKVPAGQVVDQL